MPSTVGRNDPCPCGSGLKYKKCCLLEARSPNGQHPNKSPNKKEMRGSGQPASTREAAITFETLKKAEPEDLAWIGSRNKTQARNLADILVFLVSGPALEVSSEMNQAGGIRLIFEYNSANEHDPYADEIPFAVAIEEENPGGKVGLGLSFSHPSLSASDVEIEANASLFLTSLALSEKSQGERDYPYFIESTAQSVRAEFNQAIKKRKAKMDDLGELNKILVSTELVKMTIVATPRFADSTLIRSTHPLMSQLQTRKKALSKNSTRLKKFIELQLAPHERSALSDTLSTIFFQTPEQIKNPYLHSPMLVELANRLKYHFSDETVIGASEILRHPYLKLVPPDLLPGGYETQKPDKLWKKKFTDVALQPKPSPYQLKMLNELRLAATQDSRLRYYSSYDDYEFPDSQRINLVLNSILFAIGQRLELGEIAVDLEFAESDGSFSSVPKGEEDAGTLEKCISLRSLSVPPRPIFEWGESFSPLSVEVSPQTGLVGDLFTVASRFQLRAIAPESQATALKISSADSTPIDSISAESNDPAEASQVGSPLIALEGGYLDLDQMSLLLSPVRKIVRQLASFEHGAFAEQKLSAGKALKPFDPRWTSVGFSAQMAPVFHLSLNAWGADSRFDLFEKLKRIRQFGINLPEQKNFFISAEPQIHFGLGGQFSIVRKLEQDVPSLSTPWLHGMSPRGREILQVLAHGISGFFRVESKALASKKKNTRDFELRLMRHQGVANLILHEALHLRIRGTTTDGQKIKSGSDLIQLLEPKIIALAKPTTLSKREMENADEADAAYLASLRLQDLCAVTVHKKLKDFASHFAAPENSFFTTIVPEGEIVIRDMYMQEAELILTILDHAAVASKGEIFMRARMNLFEKMMPEDNGRSRPERGLSDIQILMSKNSPDLTNSPAAAFNIFQLPFHPSQPSNDATRARSTPSSSSSSARLKNAISALRVLSKSGFQFYFGGRKLNELTSDDLKAELSLSEQAPESRKSKTTQLQSQSLNWFELHPKLFLHGKEMIEADAKRLLDEGMMEHEGQFYLVPAHRLPSLQKLGRFWERLQQNKGKPAKGFARQETVFQVPPSEVLEMLALRATGISVNGNKRWQEICRFYDGLEHPGRKFTLPSSIRGELKPYQRLGVQRLYELYRIGLGSVLADDMGLGKTLQALSFLEKLRSENEMGRVLIVVPTSLTYNWLAERDKFTPELPMMGFANKLKDQTLDFLNQPGSVVLTTYGLMQEHREFFQNIQWNIVLFDEAQNLKNISAQRTTVARSLQANIKLSLTGTPLENHFGEFFSLLDLAVPGCLGSLDSFRETFVNPSSIELSDVQYLKLKTKPLLLRRTKKEILSELPDKQESQVALDFESKQKEIYRDIAISYNEKIQQTIRTEGEAKCQLQMLTALLRLRQACSDPGALPNVKYTKVSPKRELLAESIVEIIESGESALIFTQFLHTLGTVEADLRRLKLPTFVIHGALSKSQRERALTDFNATEGGAILLMTLKTGGVGLNLTKASYVFHLEPWWNPAVENQATDRAHRMGQKRSVQVYRYIMRDSVEEKIEHLKAQKQKRFDAIFSDSEDPDQLNSQVEMKKGIHLSKEDFAFLLSAGNRV